MTMRKINKEKVVDILLQPKDDTQILLWLDSSTA